MENKQLQIYKIRHSLAHIMAQAVMEIFPDKTKLAIGPPIENGFYYDFDLPRALIPKDLQVIEKRMKAVIKEDHSFVSKQVNAKEARQIFSNQPYKLELIEELKKRGEKITINKTGEVFVDLCKGGHVENTKEINVSAFKLIKTAGAYWKGDEKRPMLTRIYGVAFETRKELQDYFKKLKEAERRDHKKLGKALDLFVFSPLVGPGLPLFTPKGETIKNELEKFIRNEKEKCGYTFVHIPHIAKAELYEKSGHLGKYDAMMPIMTDQEGSRYALKPMNCPHHFELYKTKPHSYRELPIRYAENTTVYRNEKSGELSGLVRVKSLTQDDTHHFVRYDQIQPEIKMILELMQKIYTTFALKDYTVNISIRDPNHPENYFGDNNLWEKAEDILTNSVNDWGVQYEVVEGEAAFYGPKIDITVKDSIGRSWQLTTIQLDFNQPENFDLAYTGEDGKKHRLAVVHVAVLGAIERFMAILIEHYAGKFPAWLAPVQAVIIPISDRHHEYAWKVFQNLKNKALRVEVDDRTETMQTRVRDAQIHKVPYMLIIGDREAKSESVSIRLRNGEDLKSMPIEKFIQIILADVTIDSRKVSV